MKQAMLASNGSIAADFDVHHSSKSSSISSSITSLGIDSSGSKEHTVRTINVLPILIGMHC